MNKEQSEMLVAELADYGYEGFEETDSSLKAYIPENLYDEIQIKEMSDRQAISFSKIIIPETNWNQVWESNFQPVIVDDFVAIRAEFHEPMRSAQYEIVITPKMSFGTGHHATTFMMIQQMKDIGFNNKTVFDFGTGTGILAILAEKLGANKVVGTDNDEWSINNATENIERNQCKNIELRLSSFVPAEASFDIILANINKNVILANLNILKQHLNTGGILILSGLLKEDKNDILQAIDKNDLKFINTTQRSNWLSFRLSNS